MERLTQLEIITAKSIIGQGLSRAAQSLSFFMKENIVLHETNFDITIENKINIENILTEKKLFVLSTEIKGQLGGICFLVFSDEEKNELCRAALPSEIVNNPDKLSEMEQPLLLEIDNIISAAVITELANHLKKKVHGDVPKLNHLSPTELKELIQKSQQPDKLVIAFQTEFVSSKSHFHPDFFWILDPAFIHSVKKILQEQEN